MYFFFFLGFVLCAWMTTKTETKKNCSSVYTCFRPNLFHCHLIQLVVAHNANKHNLFFCVCLFALLVQIEWRHWGNILFQCTQNLWHFNQNNKTYDCKYNKRTVQIKPNRWQNIHLNWVEYKVPACWAECVSRARVEQTAEKNKKKNKQKQWTRPLVLMSLLN